MKTRYSHLTLSDRRQIERLRHARISATEIARLIGRHRSTVFRELRRNRYYDPELTELSGYWCVTAHGFAGERCFRQRKLVRHPELAAQVTRCQRAG